MLLCGWALRFCRAASRQMLRFLIALMAVVSSPGGSTLGEKFFWLGPGLISFVARTGLARANSSAEKFQQRHFACATGSHRAVKLHRKRLRVPVIASLGASGVYRVLGVSGFLLEAVFAHDGTSWA